MGFYKTFPLSKLPRDGGFVFRGPLDISTHPAMDYPAGVMVVNTEDNKIYYSSMGTWVCASTEVSVGDLEATEFNPVSMTSRGVIMNNK